MRSKLIGILCILSGVLIGILFVSAFYEDTNAKLNWDATEAIIVEVDSDKSGVGTKSHTTTDIYIEYSYNGEYFPYVKYDTEGDVGDKVTIYVNPDKPADISDGNPFNDIFWGIILVIMFIGAGIAVLKEESRRRRGIGKNNNDKINDVLNHL